MVLYKYCFLYLFWSKFDFRKLPTVLVVSFLTGLTFLRQKSTYSRNSNHRWKIREQNERKFSYNPCQNVLELYCVLVQILLTTSKTKLDIYFNKLGMRVVSRTT